MIKPEERFMSEGQTYFGSKEIPDAPAYCSVWDWDQLRMIKVKGTAKLFPPDEDLEVPILAQFADYLSPQISAVTVDNDGLISKVSTDPIEDDTEFVAYLPFSTTESLHGCRTINYSRLQDIDQLGPGVDLSLYSDESGNSQKVAFKFNPLGKPRRLQMAWDELNILKSLPPHENIVPLDRVVLEESESRVIGFTTKYIPDLGIMHQDVAPRNLLIDPETHKILLFDFDWVACGKKNLLDGRDDVTGVVFAL
ncbi:Atypical serine/threonine protein kinase BUD32 [Fusarium acuminatum]|uniref:non-specific serine/threonine protein kinase n=1 Tax=Fusarium acuminatum TaxID=5515 RepID=A0ABZ2WYH9_9HYPO